MALLTTEMANLTAMDSDAAGKSKTGTWKRAAAGREGSGRCPMIPVRGSGGANLSFKTLPNARRSKKRIRHSSSSA